VGVVPHQLFASAAAHYARFRSGYPRQDVVALADRLRLDGSRIVLDVGCGSGQLSLPLADRAGTVIAIDPVPEMLTLGQQAAQAAGVGNIVWLQGDASQLERIVPPGAHAAIFAASFHWTDRPTVAQTLDRLLDATGAIVTINDDLDDAEQPDWVPAITEVRHGYLGTGHASEIERFTCPADDHATVLGHSPFSVIETLTWQWERQLTVDEVVGLQFTYSVSTPALFGDRAHAFAEDVRAAVLELHPSERVTEPFRLEVLIATRPTTHQLPDGFRGTSGGPGDPRSAYREDPRNGLRDDGVGLDLDQQCRVDQSTDLEYRGGRADDAEDLPVYLPHLPPTADVGDEHAGADDVLQPGTGLLEGDRDPA